MEVYPACEELLKISGWVVQDNHVRLRDDSHVHIVSQLLESLCRQKDVNQTQVTFSGNSSSKSSVDEYKALILAIINGNICKIKNLLKPCNIFTSRMYYGFSANL